jgi:hypothetical protein
MGEKTNPEVSRVLNLARQGGWHPKREQQEYRYLERQKFLRERRAWSIPISISYREEARPAQSK